MSSSQVGDGVDARYEFEVVELQPVWNEVSACLREHRISRADVSFLGHFWEHKTF